MLRYFCGVLIFILFYVSLDAELKIPEKIIQRSSESTSIRILETKVQMQKLTDDWQTFKIKYSVETKKPLRRLF